MAVGIVLLPSWLMPKSNPENFTQGLVVNILRLKFANRFSFADCLHQRFATGNDRGGKFFTTASAMAASDNKNVDIKKIQNLFFHHCVFLI